MIILIRCWSCGKPIGHLWEEYKEKVEKGESKKEVLDNLGCAAEFLSSLLGIPAIDVTDHIDVDIVKIN